MSEEQSGWLELLPLWVPALRSGSAYTLTHHVSIKAGNVEDGHRACTVSQDSAGQGALLWGSEDWIYASPTSPAYLAPEFATPGHGERGSCMDGSQVHTCRLGMVKATFCEFR